MIALCLDSEGIRVGQQPPDALGGLGAPAEPQLQLLAAFKTLPAFCRVTMRLTPSNDSDIRAEVWLPQSGWNRKLSS